LNSQNGTKNMTHTCCLFSLPLKRGNIPQWKNLKGPQLMMMMTMRILAAGAEADQNQHQDQVPDSQVGERQQ